MLHTTKRARSRTRRCVRTGVLLVVSALVVASVTTLLLLLLALHTGDASSSSSLLLSPSVRAGRQQSSLSWWWQWRWLRMLSTSTTRQKQQSSQHDSNNNAIVQTTTTTTTPRAAAATTTTTGYRSELAWIGLHYCKAAYCPAETLANWSCGAACAERGNGTFVLFRITRNESKGTAGFTGVDHGLRALVVAYRGSYNTANWIDDLSYWATPYPVTACGVGCAVHRGFYHAYASVRAEVMCDLAALHARYPDYTLLLTGHSLGAAMALLTALDVVVSDDDDDDSDSSATRCRSSFAAAAAHDMMTTTTGNAGAATQQQASPPPPRRLLPLSAVPMQVYTFGEPRVGNAAFSRWATSMFSSSNSSSNTTVLRQQYRITHARDVVPHLPPRTSGYTHVPHELWYSNHSRKDNNSSSSSDDSHDGAVGYRDCDDDATHEDAMCSEGVWATSVADHLFYLGVCTRCVCTAAELREAAAYTPSARVRAALWADYVAHHHHHHSNNNRTTMTTRAAQQRQ